MGFDGVSVHMKYDHLRKESSGNQVSVCKTVADQCIAAFAIWYTRNLHKGVPLK